MGATPNPKTPHAEVISCSSITGGNLRQSASDFDMMFIFNNWISDQIVELAFYSYETNGASSREGAVQSSISGSTTERESSILESLYIFD